MRYTPLHVKSHFSFLEGACAPDELVETAHHMGLTSLALTDRNGVQGVVRAWLKARELGLRVMCGCMTESTVGISALAQLVPLLDFVVLAAPRLA